MHIHAYIRDRPASGAAVAQIVLFQQKMQDDDDYDDDDIYIYTCTHMNAYVHIYTHRRID